MTRPTTCALLLLLVLPGCKRTEAPAAIPAEARKAVLDIVATCASAVGEVQVRRRGHPEWEAVEPGSVFRVGDEVRTGALATARIEFTQGGGAELSPLARVVIELAPPAQGTEAAESRIAVQEGEVRGRLPEAGAATAAIVIRGPDGGEVRLARGSAAQSVFRLTPAGGRIQVAVVQGDAVLTGAGGQPTAVHAGQLALASGAGPADLSELIGFPESITPGVDAHAAVVGTPIRFGWSEVPGATGYRIQIASDLSFQRLEAARDTTDHELAFAPAAAGLHAWRVAARDAAGHYGEYGFARRVFVDEAPRELLLAPPDGAAVRAKAGGARVRFTWSPVAEAAGYRLVVAWGPDLRDEVASAHVAEPEAQLTLAEPGDVWWGVYAERDGARTPLFVTARKLTVGKPPPPKADVPSSISQWGQ